MEVLFDPTILQVIADIQKPNIDPTRSGNIESGAKVFDEFENGAI